MYKYTIRIREKRYFLGKGRKRNRQMYKYTIRIREKRYLRGKGRKRNRQMYWINMSEGQKEH